jgi:hypothetical protein
MSDHAIGLGMWNAADNAENTRVSVFEDEQTHKVRLKWKPELQPDTRVGPP